MYLDGIAELLNSNLDIRCRLLLRPRLLISIILVLLPFQENNPECLSLLHSLNPKLLPHDNQACVAGPQEENQGSRQTPLQGSLSAPQLYTGHVLLLLVLMRRM